MGTKEAIEQATISMGMEIVNYLDDRDTCATVQEISHALGIYGWTVRKDLDKKTTVWRNIGGGPLVKIEDPETRLMSYGITCGVLAYIQAETEAVKRCGCPRGEWTVSAPGMIKLGRMAFDKVGRNV